MTGGGGGGADVDKQHSQKARLSKASLALVNCAAVLTADMQQHHVELASHNNQ